MSVTSAVEAAEEARAATTSDEKPLPALVRDAVERQHDVLQAVLPSTMARDRFEQMTLAAIKASPRLIKCFETLEGRTSVLFAVIQAAGVGLEVNTIAEEAYLIPREISYTTEAAGWSKRWEARLQFGYRGVRKVAYRDPRVKQIYAEVVRKGDHFIHRRGLEADVFEHEILGPTDRELTHAYCVIRYHDAPAFVRVLDREEVEARRAMSTAWQEDMKNGKKQSPWSKWPAEQWRKTAIHAIRRELDLNPADQRALELEDQTVTVDTDTGELLARSPQTGVLPSGDDPPAPAPEGRAQPLSEAPAPQSAAEAGDLPAGPNPIDAAVLRARVTAGLPKGKHARAVAAVLEAVRAHFSDAKWGTLDDVAASTEANVWAQMWIEERDSNQG